MTIYCVEKAETILEKLGTAVLPESKGLETESWIKLKRIYPGIDEDVQLLLGQEMRRRRKLAGLTQIQLACKVFCSATVISNIEHGFVYSNMTAFNNLCEYFELMLGSLLYLSQVYCLYHYKLALANQAGLGPHEGAFLLTISENPFVHSIPN